MDQLETKDNPSITAGHLDNNHIYSDTNALSEKVREAIQKEDLEEKTVVAPKMETFVSGSIIPTTVCDDLVKFYNDDKIELKQEPTTFELWRRKDKDLNLVIKHEGKELIWHGKHPSKLSHQIIAKKLLKYMGDYND